MKIRDRNRKKEKSSRSQLRGKAPVRPPTANLVASAGGRMYNESTSCLYQQSGRMKGAWEDENRQTARGNSSGGHAARGGGLHQRPGRDLGGNGENREAGSQQSGIHYPVALLQRIPEKRADRHGGGIQQDRRAGQGHRGGGREPGKHHRTEKQYPGFRRRQGRQRSRA